MRTGRWLPLGLTLFVACDSGSLISEPADADVRLDSGVLDSAPGLDGRPSETFPSQDQLVDQSGDRQQLDQSGDRQQLDQSGDQQRAGGANGVDEESAGDHERSLETTGLSGCDSTTSGMPRAL